jgi:hypothetical protein
VVVDAHDLGHGRVGFLVADDEVGARRGLPRRPTRRRRSRHGRRGRARRGRRQGVQGLRARARDGRCRADGADGRGRQGRLRHGLLRRVHEDVLPRVADRRDQHVLGHAGRPADAAHEAEHDRRSPQPHDVPRSRVRRGAERPPDVRQGGQVPRLAGEHAAGRAVLRRPAVADRRLRLPSRPATGTASSRSTPPEAPRAALRRRRSQRLGVEGQCRVPGPVRDPPQARHGHEGEHGDDRERPLEPERV